MEGRTQEGLSFMEKTAPDWTRCNVLATHNHWHVALYHVENEDYEAAGRILDQELLPR